MPPKGLQDRAPDWVGVNPAVGLLVAAGEVEGVKRGVSVAKVEGRGLALVL